MQRSGVCCASRCIHWNVLRVSEGEYLRTDVPLTSNIGLKWMSTLYCLSGAVWCLLEIHKRVLNSALPVKGKLQKMVTTDSLKYIHGNSSHGISWAPVFNGWAAFCSLMSPKWKTEKWPINFTCILIDCHYSLHCTVCNTPSQALWQQHWHLYDIYHSETAGFHLLFQYVSFMLYVLHFACSYQRHFFFSVLLKGRVGALDDQIISRPHVLPMWRVGKWSSGMTMRLKCALLWVK